MLLFTAGLLYASVGHGGASAYIVVLLFFSFPIKEASSQALILNIMVSGLALYTFHREGHFNYKFMPGLLIASVPAAFLGGSLHIRPRIYYFIFSIVLMFMAFRIILGRNTKNHNKPIFKNIPDLRLTIPLGAIIFLIPKAMIHLGNNLQFFEHHPYRLFLCLGRITFTA
jgi:uncharacterized membrane protein YfcA